MSGTNLKFGSEATNRRSVESTRPVDVRQLIETALDASRGSLPPAQIIRPGKWGVILIRDTGSEHYLPVRVPEGNPMLPEVFS